MNPRMTVLPVLIPCVMPCMIVLAACTPRLAEAPAPAPSAAATAPPAASSAPSTPSTPAPDGTPSALAAPGNVRLEGRLPDLSTPVPPGEGEAGRLTVVWDGGAGATGFRVYLKDCDGAVQPPIEVAASDHRFGPVHACRPTGNIGVAAVYPGGTSATTWVR